MLKACSADHPAQVVEVRATQPLKPGDELYADYGKDPRTLGYLT